MFPSCPYSEIQIIQIAMNSAVKWVSKAFKSANKMPRRIFNRFTNSVLSAANLNYSFEMRPGTRQ